MSILSVSREFTRFQAIFWFNSSLPQGESVYYKRLSKAALTSGRDNTIKAQMPAGNPRQQQGDKQGTKAMTEAAMHKP
ncbi:MAG: hypothetical protein DME24_00330 [Verrucomicrobia bacterium]|nr:MAG: hypothetical protein DME24_00330 [Verrucomicrobiota bacterium]